MGCSFLTTSRRREVGWGSRQDYAHPQAKMMRKNRHIRMCSLLTNVHQPSGKVWGPGDVSIWVKNDKPGIEQPFCPSGLHVQPDWQAP